MTAVFPLLVPPTLLCSATPESAARVRRALAAYPPCAARLVPLNGVWQLDPSPSPVNWNQRFLPLLGDEHGVHWHHCGGGGTAFAVSVTASTLPVPPGYELMTAGAQTLLARTVVEPPVLQDEPLPGLENKCSGALEYAGRLLKAGEGPNKEALTQTGLARAGLGIVRSALLQFCKQYGERQACAPRAEVLTYFAREATGLPVTVRPQNASSEQMRCGGRYEVRLQLWGLDEPFTLHLVCELDSEGFNWWEPVFFQYMPNLGRF